MKIAQIAPFPESVPPALYGGTERIASCLQEEPVALGHDVTLFASGDAITTAELVPVCPRALRLRPDPYDAAAAQAVPMELLSPPAQEFGDMHFHKDWTKKPLFSRLGVSFLMNLHGRLDSPDVSRLLHKASAAAVVSISETQRNLVAPANWLGSDNLQQPQLGPGKYLAFLWRMCRETRPDAAIPLARRLGQPIRSAAKSDKCDRERFCTIINLLLAGADVEVLGKIDANQNARLLGEALALMFPIDWPEPFGLVMIEPIACSTPVIALRRGSVSEVVRHSMSGPAP